MRPLYRDMLVKDCFANLFAGWACRRFSQVRPVLLIRNPFATELSKQNRHRAYWPTDPGDLLAQVNLRADFLEPFVDVITRTSCDGDEVQCLLATWAIINMVPLRQFPPSELHVCFYEDIFNDPRAQLRALYDIVDRAGQRTEIDLGANVVSLPVAWPAVRARW